MSKVEIKAAFLAPAAADAAASAPAEGKSRETRGKVAVKKEDDTGSSSKRTRGKVAVKEEEDTSGPGVGEMEEDGDSDDSDRHRRIRSDRAYPEDLEKSTI